MQKLSIRKLVSGVNFPPDQSELLQEMSRRIENFVNSGNRVMIYNDATKHLPTLKKGDVVLDFVANPNYVTLYQYSGKKKVAATIAPFSTANPSVYGEIPVGNADGTNAAFSLKNTLQPGTSRVFVDGQRKVPGIDYTEGTQGITMNTPPPVGAKVVVDYGIAAKYVP